MSCDYSVWHTNTPLTSVEAGRLHARLCEGDTSGVAAHPGIAAFYAELTAKHPEIDDLPEDQVDDAELCPWSIAFDQSDGHIIMCCVWSKADYVGSLVSSLATKHGLAFYDPQSERVVYPGIAQEAPRPWWKVW
ncbi:hypothetical protein [Rhizobacter sp. Root1221]|uniref:hypothetical protein n=1 Tax=Rhizobacter sp. Root1221 TaxID=1736433 RepID=UPI000714936D|nr:hypothetical protein [Rhizobacter sp. Root1221]KQV94567.1 hypothetical protein ASC87_26075 [Rhizobacter sp. Root1221]